jgi:glycosyltransferase involved in cell wall biosynthesis
MTRSRPAHADARVLCVSGFPGLGGAEISLLDTVTCLSRRGFPVEVLNLIDQPGPLAPALEKCGVPVHVCPVGRFRDPRSAVRVVQWFVRHAGRFDVALANDGRAALYTALGTAFRGLPYIWHVRDLAGSGERLARLAIRLRPAMWLANSHAVRASLIRQGCAETRIAVVHNGVDVSRFDPARSPEPFRHELGLDRSTLLVGAVGRLVPWKALETLLEAAARPATGDAQAAYVIIGDVVTDTANHAEALRYRETLLGLRDRLGLGDRVRFLGGRSDIPRVMAGLDILVHTAIEEPFGRVLIEAMAAGTAVVASRGGGVTEIVEHGVTGYLVPPRDADAVAASIRLLADPERRSTMGRAGRERVLAHFTLEAYGDGIAEVITGVRRHGAARAIGRRPAGSPSP